MDLAARRVLVTGGGRGIGEAAARELGGSGASVAVAARSRADVEALARELSGRGMRVVALVADVSSPDACAAMVREACDALGGIDILINAAGVAPSAPLVKTTNEQWREALETNLSGAFFAMRAALPGMLAAGWGRVVNVASIAGKTGMPYISAYAASKHGLLGLTKCAALEVADKGVTVNAVCPGYVDTAMTDVSVARIAAKTGLDAGEIRRRLAETSPQKRLYTATEVAALIGFLCSDAAAGINGQALSIDGGTVV
jgi:NAD(P)-dependent dehydrogenase (short-subunit alcohol dehydrogenase family)